MYSFANFFTDHIFLQKRGKNVKKKKFQSINALDVANLSEQEIIRKILQTLPKPRYNIVKALLFEKDFTTLTITEVVNKIRSHEMFMMEDRESSTSHSSAKKDLAL
jgi:hypothetical protein